MIKKWHLERIVSVKENEEGKLSYPYDYFLQFIVDPAKRKQVGDDSETSAQICYEQIKEFVSHVPSHIKLGDLLQRLLERGGKDGQQDLNQGAEGLKQILDQGDLMKIWEKMLKWNIESIPFAHTALNQLDHDVKQIIFTGAPGTGKTYIATLLAKYLGTQLPNEEKPFQFVQFHPSYDYTDFVEGLRPVQIQNQGESGEKGPSGSPAFVKLDGAFKKFCRRVVAQNLLAGNMDNKYFFLIDEINRADLSKVFGELMYCLEADKRGPENRVKTQYQNLPTYDLETKDFLIAKQDIFAEGFYIPENVYIIGTMNDIDRSVESMDFALRRRFLWQEVKVEHALLESAFQSGNFGPVLKEEAVEAAQRVMALNEVICPPEEQKQVPKKPAINGTQFGLNRQYYISQGQFANLPNDKQTKDLNTILNYVWDYRVESLLREYVRGEDEEKAGKFIEECKNAFGVGDKSGA